MKILRGAAAAAAIAGSLLSMNAQAVNLSTDGIGEVAIAPYYTARDGWLTAINLTNTTRDQIVVKVRFHEAMNSRDVLDFTVTMSAFDVFSGVVKAATADDVAAQAASGNPNFDFAVGDPIFVGTDTPNAAGLRTCTSPAQIGTGTPVALLTQGVTGVEDSAGNQDPSADGGPGGSTAARTAAGIDRLREGYIEFIVEGHASAPHDGTGTQDGTGGGLLNVAEAIEDHNCGVVDDAFLLDNIGTTAQQFGEPTNALKFNFRLLKPEEGYEAGNIATAWANFYNPASGADREVLPANNDTCTITRGDERFDGPAGRTQQNWVPDGSDGNSCRNLITAQESYSFLEPSLNDAFPQVANFYDDSENEFVSWAPTNATSSGVAPEAVRGVDALSATIQRRLVYNEWSEVSGVVREITDWIITMPTKSFYVDGSNDPTEALGEQFALKNPAPSDAFDARGDARLATNVPYAPFDEVFGPKNGSNPESAMSCNNVGITLYDRAEQTTLAGVSGGTSVSPAPPPVAERVALCYEANVVTFNNFSNFGTALNRLRTNLRADTTVNSVINRDPAQTDPGVSTANIDAETGWLFMDLTLGANATLGLPGSATRSSDLAAAGTTANESLQGLPVIGFALKTRQLQPGPKAPNLSRNTTSSIDHSYMR